MFANDNTHRPSPISEASLQCREIKASYLGIVINTGRRFCSHLRGVRQHIPIEGFQKIGHLNLQGCHDRKTRMTKSSWYVAHGSQLLLSVNILSELARCY